MDTRETASTPPDAPDSPPRPLSPPESPRQMFPSWKQALVTFFGGIVLAATACVGFLTSLGGNFERGGDPVLTPLAAILFFVGVVTFLVGVVFLIVRFARARTEKKNDPRVPDQPGQRT